MKNVMKFPVVDGDAPRGVDNLRQPEARKAWDRRMAELGKVTESADAIVLAGVLLDSRREFSAAVNAVKGRLLGNPLCWEPEDRAFSDWVAAVYGTLARSGTRLAERTAQADPGNTQDLLLQDIVASALVSRGHAHKWHAIAGSAIPATSIVRVHALFRLAERRGFARAQAGIIHDEVSQAMTIEGLYLRVLLLDFFYGGNLTRQQVEILDGWLWSWAGEYRLTAEPEKGDLGLWVDLQADAGVRSSFMAPTGLDVRFLVIASLHDQVEQVIAGFHCGLIFPSRGVASTFRIEEHVAVIDFLKTLLTRLRRTGGAPRQARRSPAMARVEGYVGLGEIFTRGLAPPLPPGSVPEKSRRWFRIRDVSDAGVKLVVTETDWQPIEVGDLVGFRDASSGNFVIGEVVRKVPDPEPQCVQLGVLVLSRDPRRLTLPAARTAATGVAPIDAIYLYGDDSSGRSDSLLVSDTAVARFGVRRLEIDGKVFAVDVNRMRRQGRGWVAAGFEAVFEGEAVAA